MQKILEDLAALTRIDPLSYPLINRIILARTLLDENAPRINRREIRNKIDYILDLSNEPLQVNNNDRIFIRNALQEHLESRDIHENIDFVNEIDRLVRDHWNHDIDNRISLYHQLRKRETSATPEIQGGRRKSRRTRKYKK